MLHDVNDICHMTWKRHHVIIWRHQWHHYVDEIFWQCPGWYNEELTKVWWWCLSFMMSKWAKNTIIAVAWTDCGAGNDPESLGLVCHHQDNAMHSNIVATWQLHIPWYMIQLAMWEYWSASGKEVCTLWVLLFNKAATKLVDRDRVMAKEFFFIIKPHSSWL